MKRKLALIGSVFLYFAGPLFGGDLSTFANLGFSDDSKYFMFAQYGIDEETTFPYADLYLVDVSANRFVPQGVVHQDYPVHSQPGTTGEGALYTLLGSSLALKNQFAINHLKTGRILYLLVDGEEPKERLDFRDFLSGKQYQVTLVQSAVGEGEGVSSSFYIDLTVTSGDSQTKHYRVGLPNFRRKGVKRYRIRQIILSPHEGSLVFLVEKEEVDKRGSNIRYMVETVRLS
jgi:predicted secreted protein